ncbi:MAG TPA: 50S ribosomal protein L6 [Candidatus Norongarragalinales archaeon]|nr:50S ribosomal protein L6 [Candidatus Norongarragalinales archaeon]
MDIPPGIVVSVQGRTLTVKGPNGLLEKALPQAVEVMVEGSAVTVKTSAKKQTRPVRAKVNAVVAHLRNMIRGVSTPYEKKLQLVYSHFPVTLDVKPGFIFIKNFLGEKTPRKANIQGKTTVSVKGQDIVVSGADKEDVGQTASNLIRATKILHRDIRVFQDGIYYSS